DEFKRKIIFLFFFFSSRRRHTRFSRDWSSDVCSSDLLSFIPIIHCPYKSVDDQWEGISNIEKVESLLSAINDRLVQIDYILWKHADPTAYGPPAGVDQIKIAGRYILLEKDDATPGYMEWNSQLTAAFEELDLLIEMVFAISETS